MRIPEMGNLGDLSPQGSVAVGILVGLISTTVQAIGLTLQRKSHILEDEKHPYDLRRPPYKRRRWQLGMLMFVISNIVGSTIQITTLPLPVLSTLQASGLVFNTIFASLILGEAFTRYSVIGTGLVCLGAILIAVFGAVGEPAHSLDQLLELLQRRNFILWMAGTAVLVLVISLCSEMLKFLASPHRSRHPSIRRSYALHIPMAQSRVRLIRGLCFGSISGILSAHTLLFAKSAVELLVRTIVDRSNQFNRWQSWLILITMVMLALTQLYQLHCGLKLCSTSVLYPFVFCIYNIIAILDGLIYFRQMSQLAGFHAGLIALGTIILLGGVLCLSWRLEVIDSHAGVTVVGPSQTGLGPGMAILEERPRSPRSLRLEDEESRTGEREPLLQTVRGSPRQRTPSLPLISSSPKRDSTDTDPASIWAELDDSDYDYADSNLQSTIHHRSSVGTFPTRPRSNTWRDNILRGPRRATAGSISQHTWNSHRIRSPQKRRTYFGPFPGTNQDRTAGYGTQDDRTDYLHSTSSHPQSSTNSHSTTGAHSLPSSRSTFGRTWRAGLQYLSHWTSRRSRTESHDSITSPSPHDNEPSRE